MWDATHVQVTVQKARGLIIKGKNGTNNCFVIIALGKQKFQTSVIPKATENVEWHEECELKIPEKGNVAEIVLKVFDEDTIKDHLLGQVSIPLKDFDVYDRPRNQWYPLVGKPGKEQKNRGELEVKVAFTVHAGSLTDLNKKDKHKTSISSLAHNIGGSVMSIGSFEKKKMGIGKIASKIGSKMNLYKKDKKSDSSSLSGSVSNLKSPAFSSPKHTMSKGMEDDADPGVRSDDDEFYLEDLSHKSSGSSLNINTLPNAYKYTPSPVNASLENLGGGELLRRTTVSHLTLNEKPAPSKPVRLSLANITPAQVGANVVVDRDDEWSRKLYSKSKQAADREKSASLERNKKLESPISLKEKMSPKFFPSFGSNTKPKKLLEERIIVGEENIIEEDNTFNSSLPQSMLQQFEGKSREDLIVMICNLQKETEAEKKKSKDLENYLDDLLLRVMEATPRVLQNPYVRNNSMHIRNK